MKSIETRQKIASKNFQSKYVETIRLLKIVQTDWNTCNKTYH